MSRLANCCAALAVLVGAQAAGPASASAGGGWTWPVLGEVARAFRTSVDPFAAGQHRGIDIASRPGTPVVAAAAGVVRFAGTIGTSGLTISIRTSDGRFDSSYIHLSSATVGRGDQVDLGQRIGAVGTSGRPSGGPAHLHFGVRVAGSRHGYRDPLGLLAPVAPAGREPRLGPAPRSLPSPLPVRRFGQRRPSPAIAPRELDVGWALACLALIALAATAGRSSIGARAVLRHNADLLRERRAAPRPRLHDGRG